MPFTTLNLKSEFQHCQPPCCTTTRKQARNRVRHRRRRSKSAGHCTRGKHDADGAGAVQGAASPTQQAGRQTRCSIAKQVTQSATKEHRHSAPRSGPTQRSHRWTSVVSGSSSSSAPRSSKTDRTTRDRQQHRQKRGGGAGRRARDKHDVAAARPVQWVAHLTKDRGGRVQQHASQTDNKAGAEGARALSRALKTNTTLLVLNLHGLAICGARARHHHNDQHHTVNEIGDKGARAVSKALQSNSTLTALYIGGEPATANKTRSSQEAAPSRTQATTLGAGRLRWARRSSPIRHLPHCTSIVSNKLACCTSATRLTAPPPKKAGNEIGGDGARAMSEALQANTTLTELHMECQPATRQNHTTSTNNNNKAKNSQPRGPRQRSGAVPGAQSKHCAHHADLYRLQQRQGSTQNVSRAT